MNDREKVIVELTDSIEILSDFDTQEYTLCERQQLHGSVVAAIQDAIDLLKAQEQNARILQPNELKVGMVVWLDRFNWIDFTCVTEIRDIYENEPLRESWPSPLDKHYDVLFADYDIERINAYWHEWIAWTSKPTKEQRQAVKWDR